MAILAFLLGLLILPVGMLFLSASLGLIFVDLAMPKGRPELLLIFPAGAILLILSGARLVRGRFGLWTAIQFLAGLAALSFMCWLYRPLIQKAVSVAVTAHRSVAAKKTRVPASRAGA
ncbi:MAG TPA: hypothetical protein VL404_06680 [Candidatus Eisenbacteria bacterium]|jgi:hypothetical protein|nr:hypothetical protein [Candidatus Eisenbacteria bacterium]